MDKIIASSKLTRSWLENIKTEVSKAIPSIVYNEVISWAKFKSPITNRVIAWLNPGKKQIRLFMSLEANMEPDIKRSSSQWKKFKSIFRIDSEKKINRAIELIIQTFNYDIP